MSALRQQSASGTICAGAKIVVRRTFTAEEVREFGRLTRDYNPVHVEPRWSRLKGFDGTVCHGLLVGSMICEPGGQMGWLATGMSFRFRRPVHVGDTVTCEMTITDIDERHRARASCVLRNQHDETVVEGTLEGYLPDPQARQLLARMLAEGDPTNGAPFGCSREDG